MSAALDLTTLAARPIWVAWRNEERGGRATKVPYGTGGRRAKADDPATWLTREKAEALAEKIINGTGGGIGIEFASLDEENSLGGIDLDTCRDPASGEIKQWASEVVQRFGTYAEVSPSGTGLKLFFAYPSAELPTFQAVMGSAKFTKEFTRGGGEHPPAIEVHLANRYFTVTEQRFDGTPIEFRYVPKNDILWALTEAGPKFAGAGEKKSEPKDRSRSAAAFRKGADLRRQGKTYDEMVAALRSDPETAEWCQEKGEANGHRELRRIWKRAGDEIPTEKTQDGRSVIPVIPGEVHILADRAEDALLGAGTDIFHRAEKLVRPGYSDVTAADGRTTIAASLHALDAAAIREELSRVAGWIVWSGRERKWLPTDPPSLVAAVLAARKGRWKLRPVNGIATCPTLRPNGSILSAPGYDPETRLFMMPDPALHLPEIPEHPSRTDAEAALGNLENLLIEFPFVTETDHAVALSLIVSCVVRGALGMVPVHAFTAPAPGTGKSFIADIASVIISGRWCPVITPGKTEEELEKRLGAMLLAGYATISLDNMSCGLAGDTLCQVAERPTVRVRILGKSETPECEFRGILIANGNNLVVEGDMTRRVLLASLDARVERPEERTFSFDPVKMVLANRGLYVASAIVLVKAYMTAGMPDRLTPLASYQRWSELVRSALVWLGEADPVETMRKARESDPVLSTLRAVLTSWHDAWADEPMTSQAAGTTLAGFHPDSPEGTPLTALRAALMPVAGVRGIIDATKLSYWLRKSKGRPAAGLKLVGEEAHAGAVRWRVLPSRG